MKISRSKMIEITVILTLFFVVFAYLFLFLNYQIINDNIYVYSIDNNNIKQVYSDNEVIEVSISSVDEIKSVVYDNMTLEELSNKLEKSLNDDLVGYGSLIANYSLEKGIDPYLATAIMLHETGCTWGCSNLVKKCNNVGGMKGSGCGQYGYFSTLEQGIKNFIDNIYKNYYAYGLTNADMMGNKYAEDPGWSKKVNKHIEKIKNR